MVGRVVEVTFLLVLAYLVLSQAGGFYQVMSALGQTYTSSVKVLQGR